MDREEIRSPRQGARRRHGGTMATTSNAVSAAEIERTAFILNVTGH